MSRSTRRAWITLAVTAAIVLSLVVVAQPTAAVRTTVTGPDAVRQPDAVTFESTVMIRDGERVPLRNYTVTLWTEGAPDETVSVTFAPNGTVLDVSPPRGVIGEGEIRVELLESTIDITPLERAAGYGYGYGYGTDERSGDRVEFGYGYGYGGPSTVSFAITLDSKAFKQGTYRIRTSVNTDDRLGLFGSNTETFTVELPRGGQPPGSVGAGDRGGEDDGVDDSEDDDDSGPGNAGSADRQADDDPILTVDLGSTRLVVKSGVDGIAVTVDRAFGWFEAFSRHLAGLS